MANHVIKVAKLYENGHRRMHRNMGAIRCDTAKEADAIRMAFDKVPGFGTRHFVQVLLYGAGNVYLEPEMVVDAAETLAKLANELETER